MHTLIPTGVATAILPAGGKTKPITVIGTAAIRETFGETCLQQAVNSRLAPGVTELVLNPDAHLGYGAPWGASWFRRRTSILARSESTSSVR